MAEKCRVLVGQILPGLDVTRDGELAFPVQEVTIAGNMLDMMRNIEQAANDARFISPVASPTFKIAEMTVSGR